MLYRTARMGHHDPVETIGLTTLPKYLTSFSDREASFVPALSDEEQGSEVSILRKCRTDGHVSGISLFDKHHATRYTIGEPITAGIEYYIPFSEDTITVEKAMLASIRRDVNRARGTTEISAVYVCYAFDQASLPMSYELHRDGGNGHLLGQHSIAPFENVEVHGTVMAIGYQNYAYCPELLRQGWRPHCFRFRGERKPDDFQDNFDPEVWRVCGILYQYGLSHHCWETGSTLLALLTKLRECQYQFQLSVYSPQWLEVALVALEDVTLSLQSFEEHCDVCDFIDKCRSALGDSALKRSDTVLDPVDLPCVHDTYIGTVDKGVDTTK